MNQKNLVAEVNRLYKVLREADKGGITFDKDAYNGINKLLTSMGKRTFNLRGLTVGQRQALRMAGEKFLRSKGNTLEGAIDTHNKKVDNFNNQLRQAYGYNPVNQEMYELAFKKLYKSGAYESTGISPDFSQIVEWTNNLLFEIDQRLDKGQDTSLIDFEQEIYNAWAHANNIERESAYDILREIYPH